jgi:uncharacterized Zn finger protein
MCKHVAAVLYGIGARLDQQPELLFLLHDVDQAELIARAGKGLPLTQQGPAQSKVLGSGDLSAIFGLEMAEDAAASPEVSAGGPKKRAGKAPPDSSAAKQKRGAKARSMQRGK